MDGLTTPTVQANDPYGSRAGHSEFGFSKNSGGTSVSRTHLAEADIVGIRQKPEPGKDKPILILISIHNPQTNLTQPMTPSQHGSTYKASLSNPSEQISSMRVTATSGSTIPLTEKSLLHPSCQGRTSPGEVLSMQYTCLTNQVSQNLKQTCC